MEIKRTYNDITQFAPAERATPENLKADAERFATDPLLQALLDAVPNVFLILNEQRQMVYANRAMLDVLGWEQLDYEAGLRPGEALNCEHSDHVNGCGTTDFCRQCGAVRAILSSLRGLESIEECRIIQRDGSALDLRVWATPLELGDRRFSIFAINDISSEKRRRALERIFFHDVMNTAGALSGFIQLLNNASEEQIGEYMEVLKRVSGRLLEEIQAQKDLAAAESDELVPQWQPVNALEVLRATCQSQNTDHPLVVDSEAEPVVFHSDPVLLGRVLGNLIKNAVEASTGGQPVHVNCDQQGGFVAFHIHNEGAMPRNVQLQLFQRSFSTKGEGRGLGTYSIKLLSERYLKGDVSFVSSQTKGTTFTVRFPVMQG